MGQVAIRKAVATDAPALSVLIQRSIRTTNSRDYNPATIELICSSFTLEKVIEKMAERNVFAATCGNAIVGTISLGDGNLHSLFVEPGFQRQGIGASLVRHLERHAANAGLPVLRLSSSITARSFYERLGYVLHAFEERSHGSTYLMSKTLSP